MSFVKIIDNKNEWNMKKHMKKKSKAKTIKENHKQRAVMIKSTDQDLENLLHTKVQNKKGILQKMKIKEICKNLHLEVMKKKKDLSYHLTEIQLNLLRKGTKIKWIERTNQINIPNKNKILNHQRVTLLSLNLHQRTVQFDTQKKLKKRIEKQIRS